MVSSSGSTANPFKHSKVMFNWQASSEVTGSLRGSPTEFKVRLLDTDQDNPSH